MFEDSLVESSGKFAYRNPWTTAVSFAGEIMLGGLVMLLSLIYTEALPSHKLLSTLEAPAPPQVAPSAPTPARPMKQSSQFDHGVLMPPREIPRTVVIMRDEEPEDSAPASPWIGVPHSVPGATTNGQIADLLRTTPIAAPKVSVQKARVSSGVAQGLLIRQVKPQYPPLARQARIQGTVVLQATIGKDGTVQQLRVVSGHPMLSEAAMNAVQQWLYKPYYLNGEPVEVDTQINVNFTLGNW